MSKIQILVPALGESITEATVAKWHKKTGDFVRKDEVILELETDKITLEVSAPETGQLSSIVFQTGATVNIGTVLGEIDDTVKDNTAVPSVQKELVHIQHPSPAAQVILDSNAISSSDVSGTGRDGRITKANALDAVRMKEGKSESHEVSSKDVREKRVKMSKLRQTISKRLKSAQNAAAILTTFNEIDMFEVMKLRSEHQEEFQKKHGVKLGFMSFFVKAVVAALQEIPIINASVEEDEIIYKQFYDIGIAVGTENGLVVPVLRDADVISIAEIEKEIIHLGKKARYGKLTMNDMTGGTFSITNGGIYGSLLSTPIINPPQSAILGMHNIVQRPVGLPNGEIVLRPMMYVALSYDHRIIDGKEAVQFLLKVKHLVEKPIKILLQI